MRKGSDKGSEGEQGGKEAWIWHEANDNEVDEGIHPIGGC